MSFCIRKGYNGPKAKSLDHMAREQLPFILVFEHGWKLTKWTTYWQTLKKKYWVVVKPKTRYIPGIFPS